VKLTENFHEYVNGREIVVYGTGKDALNIVDDISSFGMEVSFFISRDWHKKPEFIGKKVYGKDVLNKEKHYVVIGTTAFAWEISLDLNSDGFRNPNDYYYYYKIFGDTLNSDFYADNILRGTETIDCDSRLNESISVHIDIIDACNLRCSTCLRGSRMIKNTAGKMNLGLFERIIKKIHAYDYSIVKLFNWSEPFLCGDLEKYTEIADRYGMTTDISSNLSLKKIENLENVLYSGRGCLYISVSGFTQEVQQINHRGSDISLIKRHLRLISECYMEKVFDRKVWVKYLRFQYNTHEVDQFAEWIDSLPGLKFLLCDGWGHPQSQMDENYREERVFHDNAAVAARYLSQFEGSTHLRLNKVCRINTGIIIDYKGDTYLCCAMPNYPLFKVGSFLDDDINDIFARKMLHPYCRLCKFEKNKEITVQMKNKIISMLDVCY